ncbi:MAG: ammonia-forming cytochrome c nitrite reductase subunit c552, partial [Myxococcales bacterium]|nr:ammonia-forming cytochrome c nitrite reductase subunit c552 [Myxococcales bacterium]
MKRGLALLAALAALAATAWWVAGVGGGTTVAPHPTPTTTPDGRVGSAECQACHPKEHAEWAKSAHAHNMARPTPQTVVGDFNDVTYVFKGTTSRMYTRDGKYLMDHTDVDGETGTYEVAWVLGIMRHQAYLFAEPDGRLQVLPTYWNLEEKSWRDSVEGPVQDWHGGAVPSSHQEHWRNFGRTYNRACMECHASFPEKGYDAETNRYTSAFDPQISCEACHGPGGEHVRVWRTLDGTGDPMRKLDRLDLRASIEVCTPCHARKRVYAPNPVPGEPFADSFAPDVWQQGTFFVDGRSSTLNYRWVDYLQNRCMDRTARKMDCGTCHPPHDLHSVKDATVVESNAICTTCHLGQKTRLTAHTHHAPESEGSRCIGCHMPKMDLQLRMTVRDHTISSPLPSLTAAYQVPNACTQCHADEDVPWAEGYVQAWYGAQPSYQRYKASMHERAEVLTQAFAGRPPVAPLVAWLDNPGLNVVQRASAAQFLALALGDPRALAALLRHVEDADPLVRYYAVRAVGAFQTPAALNAVRKALADPHLTVRVAAFETLMFLDPGVLTSPEPITAKARADFDLRRTLVRVDDPRDIPVKAMWHLQGGRITEAEQELRRGVALAPRMPRARGDLIQFLLRQRRLDDAKAEV